MAAHVNTVLGRIPVSSLGRTLVHEHVLIGMPGWYMDARAPVFKRDNAIDQAVDAFQELRAHGVRTVVDPCPTDLGRDVEIYAAVSQRTGINLICATGVYTEQQGITFTVAKMSEEALTESFVKEIEDGVDDTGIRCGVIKIATGNGAVSPYERKVLNAAARAAKLTGVPLISHTEHSSCGHEQIDIATNAGVPASSLIVGHSDGRDDHEYQRSLATRGAYVGFDRFGMTMGAVPDEIRIKNLKQLADAGHLERILVSHDCVSALKGSYEGLSLPQVQKIMPNWRMTHLFENILPELKRLGMSEDDIETIVAKNPHRYFAQAGAA